MSPARSRRRAQGRRGSLRPDSKQVAQEALVFGVPVAFDLRTQRDELLRPALAEFLVNRVFATLGDPERGAVSVRGARFLLPCPGEGRDAGLRRSTSHPAVAPLRTRRGRAAGGRRTALPVPWCVLATAGILLGNNLPVGPSGTHARSTILARRAGNPVLFVRLFAGKGMVPAAVGPQGQGQAQSSPQCELHGLLPV